MSLPSHVAIAAAALALLGPAAVAAPDSPAPEVLLYGFEPFGPFEVNPTGELVARLARQHPERRAVVLSVEPADAMGELFEVLNARPRVIVGFGVRADVAGLEVNTAATNWVAMRSESAVPFFGAIDPGLPLAIELPLAWRGTVLSRLRVSGVPHTVSPDAGMHACNLTFFQALVHAAPETRVLFIHVAPDVLTRPGLASEIARLVDALLLP